MEFGQDDFHTALVVPVGDNRCAYAGVITCIAGALIIDARDAVQCPIRGHQLRDVVRPLEQSQRPGVRKCVVAIVVEEEVINGVEVGIGDRVASAVGHVEREVLGIVGPGVLDDRDRPRVFNGVCTK